MRSRAELDLTDRSAVLAFFEQERPEYVFLAAAKVGGIHANATFPADFLRDNSRIQNNVFEAAQRSGVHKLLFLGSSCIYPKLAPQPLRESYLLSGPLEPTNEAYAIAKIEGILACKAYNRQYGTRFIAVMPPNLYGPGDSFDLATCHVLPALVRRFHEAELTGRSRVELWGSGTPWREFLYVDDLADACLFAMDHFEADGDDVFINAGAGEEIQIRDLAALVADVVGYRGEIAWDTSRPDGTPRKLLEVERLAGLGWRARTPLREGIERAYRWYLANLEKEQGK